MTGPGAAGRPLHLVSAWAARRRLVLGQEAPAGKSDAITAIPLRLERPVPAGALVTIDALGTPATIVRRGGDDLLSLEPERPATHDTTGADHGRVEQRGQTVRHDVSWMRSDRR